MNLITLVLLISTQWAGNTTTTIPAPAGSYLVVTQGKSCDGEKSAGRRIVNRFLDPKDKSYSGPKAKHNLPSATSDKIKALTGSSDAATCKRLLEAVLTKMVNHQLNGFEPSFFKSGGYYYVPLTRREKPVTPGKERISTGFSPLFVLDNQFNVVTSVAM